VHEDEVLRTLEVQPDLLRNVELLGPHGQSDRRKSKKLLEVAGFCQVILDYARRFLPDKEPIRVLDCSCGKSYLGLILVRLFDQLEDKRVLLTGIDTNEVLIEKCGAIGERLGMESVSFVVGRTLEFESPEDFDLTVALHACDTATDEAIAKGIIQRSCLIMVVPCCQNQIRGQIKDGHPLAPMSEYGPIRYRLANLLTDALRAQFLKAAGYCVEMREIGSPRVTPKNLCICARKSKRGARRRRAGDYQALRDFFHVKPKIERFCPGVI